MNECNTRDISTVVTFQSYRRNNYLADKNVITGIEKALNVRIQNTVLASPEDFVYDDKYIFDTVNYLNAEGKILRTEKLIVLLNNYLNMRE